MSRLRSSGAKLGILAASIVAMIVASLSAAFAAHQEGHLVTICHERSEGSGKFKAINTDESGVVEGHLAQHENDFIINEPDATDEDCEAEAPGDDDADDDQDDDVSDDDEEYPPKE